MFQKELNIYLVLLRNIPGADQNFWDPEILVVHKTYVLTQNNFELTQISQNKDL